MIKDAEIRRLYDNLVARRFEQMLAELRDRGHRVEVLVEPHRATDLCPEEAQLRVDGRFLVVTWDMEGGRWPIYAL